MIWIFFCKQCWLIYICNALYKVKEGKSVQKMYPFLNRTEKHAAADTLLSQNTICQQHSDGSQVLAELGPNEEQRGRNANVIAEKIEF